MPPRRSPYSMTPASSTKSAKTPSSTSASSTPATRRTRGVKAAGLATPESLNDKDETGEGNTTEVDEEDEVMDIIQPASTRGRKRKGELGISR